MPGDSLLDDSDVILCHRWLLCVQNQSADCISNGGRIVADSFCGTGKPFEAAECALVECGQSSAAVLTAAPAPWPIDVTVILIVVSCVVCVVIVAVALLFNCRKISFNGSERMDVAHQQKRPGRLVEPLREVPVATALPVAQLTQGLSETQLQAVRVTVTVPVELALAVPHLPHLFEGAADSEHYAWLPRGRATAQSDGDAGSTRAGASYLDV